VQLWRCASCKRRGDTHFASLANFLEAVPLICPHDLFRRKDDPKAQASQARPEFADPSRIIVNRKENAATHVADPIIRAVGNNKLRHETLQRFMLINDSVMVAIEIPIWLTVVSNSRRGWVRRSGRSPGTSIFYRCATARCTSWITNPTRGRIGQSHSLQSTRSL
jgi:hypothetical protein